MKNLLALLMSLPMTLTAAPPDKSPQEVTLNGETVNVKGSVNIQEPLEVYGMVKILEPQEVYGTVEIQEPLEVIPPDDSMAVSNYCAYATSKAHLPANQTPPVPVALTFENCRYLHSVTASVSAPEGIIGLYNLYLGHYDEDAGIFGNAMQLGTVHFIGNGTRDVIEFKAPYPIDLTELPPVSVVYATLTESGSAPTAIRYDISYVATQSLP